MVFYKIVITWESQTSAERTRTEKRAFAQQMYERTEEFYQKSDHKNMIFTADYNEGNAIFAVVASGREEIPALFQNYSSFITETITSCKMEEITFAAFDSLVDSAYRQDYIHDNDEVLARFELKGLDAPHNRFGESFVQEMSVEECHETANRLLFSGTLGPEIDRIYKGKAKKRVIGHPVHYFLKTDDSDIRKKAYKTLLAALYQNGRIQNKRYAYVNYDEESHFFGRGLAALYHSCVGGAVVIRYTGEDEQENGYAKRSTDIIAAISEIAVQYKNQVLTIICTSAAANRIQADFLANWGNTSFVELYEDVAFGTQAERYLQERAQAYHICADRKLFALLDSERGYTAAELNRVFEDWYCQKMKCEVYPQYKNTKTAQGTVKAQAPKGIAYQNLNNLIGLTRAKEVMQQALNYFKAQRLFADRGILKERPSMHMLFSGNPGTAKTTVARLFADVMKENGLLSTGTFYEVGRADLVGRFVGSTAPLVQAAFKKARGGVLFIDEAYSLVDDKDGLFGDEAINTIVQEMENHRKDTVVIFAGYSDKMEGFLKKNPGLRSRIAFHVPFEDYSTDELCAIATFMAKEHKMVLSDDALARLKVIFAEACTASDFGNGRFVRNAIEKAKMAHANRLMQMDLDCISDEDLCLITADDIEMPPAKPLKRIQIGFCA